MRIDVKKLISGVLFLFLAFFAPESMAQKEDNSLILPKDHYQHVSAASEGWMFTGEVETEEGEKYAYMFQIKRKEKKWIAFANIMDLSLPSKKETLMYKEVISEEKKDKPVSKTKQFIQWKVGKAFMKYNIIGDSWLFGLSGEENGFNFRVKSVRAYVQNGGRDLQASYSAQSMHINGHLTLEGKSHFVTGKNSWFEHHWSGTLPGPKASKYALVTCRFNDNTGLRLYEWFGKKDMWPIKTGTYQNALDQKILLSNFSLEKSIKKQTWIISIPALKMRIEAFGNFTPKYDVVQMKNEEGYCFVNEKGF